MMEAESTSEMSLNFNHTTRCMMEAESTSETSINFYQTTTQKAAIFVM
jgi:hypothetical protein